MCNLFDVDEYQRAFLGKSSRLLRVPLSRQILGGGAAFGAAHISWPHLSLVSGFKKINLQTERFLSTSIV